MRELVNRDSEKGCEDYRRNKQIIVISIVIFSHREQYMNLYYFVMADNNNLAPWDIAS